MRTDERTIVAVSTPAGTGGIAVVRLSGPDALPIADKAWRGKALSTVASHTAHYGEITTADGETLDMGVATIFRGPHSYTGEDTVEFSIHGSPWLQQATVARLIECGASAAGPGEFTQRAYLNGRIDLAQAEGIADMIAVSSEGAQKLAARQMKGDFSKRLNQLREQLVELASLLELELDFSEEDVEFADRSRLEKLCEEIEGKTKRMSESFRTGQAIKDGVNVVICGVPNVGKSTLLNRLLGEERALVSDIAGTTRDSIEDTAEIEGILFRFIDTAGLRTTTDEIEQAGIERTAKMIGKAQIVVRLFDATQDRKAQEETMKEYTSGAAADAVEIDAVNKCDLATDMSEMKGIRISAKQGEGIEELTHQLRESVGDRRCDNSELIITNMRHYEHLCEATASLQRVREGLQLGIPSDLIAQDLRQALHHLGEITGAITTDTLLHTIFSRFCVGK